MGWAVFRPVTPAAQTFVLAAARIDDQTYRFGAEEGRVIRSEKAFVMWHYLHHKRSLKAGEYLFERTANLKDVHDRLARGDIYVHTVVIPEGYTMFDIADAVEQAKLGTRAEFLKIAQGEPSLVQDLAPEAKSLEGYLFPERTSSRGHKACTTSWPQWCATSVRWQPRSDSIPMCTGP